MKSCFCHYLSLLLSLSLSLASDPPDIFISTSSILRLQFPPVPTWKAGRGELLGEKASLKCLQVIIHRSATTLNQPPWCTDCIGSCPQNSSEPALVLSVSWWVVVHLFLPCFHWIQWMFDWIWIIGRPGKNLKPGLNPGSRSLYSWRHLASYWMQSKNK